MTNNKYDNDGGQCGCIVGLISVTAIKKLIYNARTLDSEKLFNFKNPS